MQKPVGHYSCSITGDKTTGDCSKTGAATVAVSFEEVTLFEATIIKISELLGAGFVLINSPLLTQILAVERSCAPHDEHVSEMAIED